MSIIRESLAHAYLISSARRLPTTTGFVLNQFPHCRRLTMVLSSSFRERLEHMEQTRNERFSLLQAEKQVQATKTQIVASKISNITSIEQKCLKLDIKIASQQYTISSLKSKIDHFGSKYMNNLQHLRVLKAEVEELAELEKEKGLYLAFKARDMDEFRCQADVFAVEYRARVNELRNCVKELSSCFIKLQRNGGYSENSDLAAAEARRYELVSAKEKLDRSLTLNYQKRAQLQKQLQTILIAQNKEGRKLSETARGKCLEE